MTATPIVTITPAAQAAFIGTQQTVNLSFSNGGAPGETGYAPYIDVILPINGADGVPNGEINDGVTLDSATYLGRPVVATPYVFTGAAGTVVQIDHPFAKNSLGNPIKVSGTVGDTLLVITLPFGSFTTEQTPADVVLKLNLSNLADVGTPLPIKATAGFAFGADEFNNPGADAPIRGATSSADINPTVAILHKDYEGPEQETATGPSYPRVWKVVGEFAPGQPFTKVKLVDDVPDGIKILGAHLEVNGVTVVPAAPITIIRNADGTQTVTGEFAGTITGGTDVPKLVIDFYVDEFLWKDGTPVLGQASGSFRDMNNNAKLEAQWKPIDGRDAATTITIDPAGFENIVTAKSVAVQKGVALVNGDADGNGVPDWQPGGTLKYTLDGQVSNYFEMKELVFKDTLGDGQTFKPGFKPQVVISEGGQPIYSGDVLYTLSPKDAQGKTYVEFDVAGTLVKAKNDGTLLVPGSDAVLDGNGGGLTGNPHASNYNQATAVVTFQTTLDKNWTNPATSDNMVDQGDPVGNTVLFGGKVDFSSQYIQDNSAAGVSLPVSAVDKSIYAINNDIALGSTILTPAPKIQSGDLITYRLTLDMPLTSAHQVKLTDFMPLPVLKALDLDANGSPDGMMMAKGADGMIPLVGQWSFGPTNTLTATNGTTFTDPSIMRSGAGNSLVFNFGDITNPNYPTTHIDLLFTVRVNDAAFGDGLLLTNQVTSSETNSFGKEFQDNEIVQFVLGEPRIKITKGVVAEDNTASGYFDATTGPAGVTWNAPGSLTPFTGIITSAGLATTPVNANLFQADANDTVKFAVVLENVGSGPRGAFDLLIKDTIPTGFTLGAVPLNLKVTDGTGAILAYTGAPADLFNGGIELVDPGLHQGAVGAYNAFTGKNIVVVTYDLKLDSNVQSYARLTNTATTAQYKAVDGGMTNFASIDNLPDSDTAFVEITPKIGKIVIATSNSDTGTSEGDGSLPDVAIGELITWRVTVVVPEGQTKNLILKDILPGGLGAASFDKFELVSATVATVGSNIVGPGVAAGSIGVISNSNPGSDSINDTVTFNLGNVTNAPDNAETAADYVTFDVVARVLDVTGNDRRDVETNKAIISATAPDGSTKTTEVTSSVEIVEPVLAIKKVVSPTTVDADDTFTYTVTLTNTSGSFRAPAYDISIDDLLTQLAPNNVLGPNAKFLPGTVAITASPTGSGAAIVTGNGASDGTVKVTADKLLEGQSITLTFQAKALPGAISGQTIHNDVTADATSMPGTPPSDHPYDATDPADVTIASPSITKTVSATSFADTGSSQINAGNQDVKVDEIVTYRMVVTVPEGQSINFRIIDQLADQVTAGGGSGILQYIPGSAKVISAGANLSSTSGILTPTISNTDSDSDGNKETVTYSFGNLTNAPDNVSNGNDQIVVEIQARAVNLDTNQNADVLRNSVQVKTDFSQSEPATADVDFVQPELDIQKTTSFGTGDAADVATYQVTIKHTANSTNAAYNLVMGDLLAPGITLVGGSATTNAGSISEAGGKIGLTLGSLALGQSVTISYKAKLADNVVDGQSIKNTATLEYRTDPTPGRILNDSDDATIKVAIADTIVKELISTDNSYTPGSNVVAGETITYKLTVTLGEGAQRLIVDDVLPTGLTPVSSKVLSLGNIAGTSALNVGDAGTVSGQNLVFNFGDVINAGDNALTGGDKVEIEVVAKVAAGTAGGLALTNTATVRPVVPNNPYDVPSGTPMTPSSDPETVNTLALPKLGDKAFEDLNADGIQQGGEPGIDGVTVQLWSRDTNTLVDTQTTAGGGLYLFTNVKPGTYYEVWSLPPGFVRTTADQGVDGADSDPSATTGVTADFVMLGGQDDLTRDAGYWKPVTIGDTAFIDANGNGIQDDGAANILAGVKVQLLDGTGNPVPGKSTDTDAFGKYAFTDLKPGTYAVQFTRPNGTSYVLTGPDATGETQDSDPLVTPGAISGTTPNKTYISGANDPTVDAGFYIPAKLGNQAFVDANGNGTFDAGDSPLAGVTVKLFDSNGVQVGASVTTLADGLYKFENLRPGTYTETFTAPSGSTYVLTKQGTVAGTDNDSDPSGTGTPSGTGPSIVLVSGQSDQTHDAGFYQPVKLGDFVWLDDNGDGVQDAGEPGLGGLTVRLLDGGGSLITSTTTSSVPGNLGFYSFNNLIPGNYQVQFTKPASYTFTDALQGGNTAKDSNVDATGLALVTLTSGRDDLTIDAGMYERVTIGDTAFEDVNGDGIYNTAIDKPLAGVKVTLINSLNGKTYEFTTGADGQYLFKVPPGTYTETWAPPAGYVTTLQGVGLDRAVDSNVDPVTLKTAPITLTGGQSDLTQDGGFYRPVTIGDRVWVDLNKDGLQQTLEPGLAGVIVKLIDDRTGLQVGASQTTGADGKYLFDGLKPSEYHVEFVAPAGYKPTIQAAGPDRAIDSNVNTLGVAPQVKLNSGDKDLTVDAGYTDGGKVSGSVFLDLPPGICSYKLPEAVFEGIKVELISTTYGIVVGTTTTNAAGQYSFEGLSPSDYVLRFTNPDGTVFTSPKVAGTLNPRDSDVNPATGLTDVFTLTIGQDITQMNAGLDYTGVGLTGLQPMYLPDGGGSYNFNNAGAYAIGGNGSYNMMGNGGSVYFIGGSGDNNLQGSGSSGAILMGGGGNNIMEGTAGRDIIIGGCGPNNFQGLGSNNFQGLGGGNGCWNYDLLVGGVQNDTITSNSGNAIIIGGKGNDALDGQGVFVGGPNNGTVSFDGTKVTGFTVGDHIKISGLSTVNYQFGDGVQWIENFNPGRGDTIEVWGYAAPTATGLVNGQFVMYFGPNSAIVLNGYQPQNGPLTGVNYHPGQQSMPGAFGHLDALPPVILAPGVDSFHGTQGDDIVIATDAFSTLEGRGGDDIMFGGEGGNLFIGGPGNDTMIGGKGNDIFRAGQGSDQIIGCDGNNTVQFDVKSTDATITKNGNGTFTVKTADGEQILKDIQWVSFTDTNIHLDGVADAAGKVLFGIAGNDSFNITSVNDIVIERAGGGSDTAWVSVDGWTLSPEVENGRLIGNATSITGNALNNVLVANANKASTVTGAGGNDEIWGGSANGSVLNGGAGDDVIRSGSGIETMIGGKGNDQFVVNNVGDTVIENAGEGTDTAWVGVDGWSVGANVEIVRLFGGATTVNVVGNTQVVADAGGSTVVAQLGDNTFWGNGSNDTFVGAAGNDIFRTGGGVTKMYGGAGNDHYVIKNLGDQAFESANEGYDTAWVAVNGWTVGNNIEVAYLSGSANTLTGNSTGGNLVANSGAGSTLNAGSGLTTLWGSSFADTFNIGAGGSTVYGYGGKDVFKFGPTWKTVEIADFDKSLGEKLDFRGNGFNASDFHVTNYADKSLVTHDGSTDQIIVYGVPNLAASDLIFA